MAAFSLRLDLAEEVNRHFLENDYGDLSFWFWRGYNFKTSPFLGGKFFTGKKHGGGGQILWHSKSSLGNLKSVIYPRSRSWEKKENQLNI